METKEYLDYIANEIHRTIVATVDDEGLPVTAAIDMMEVMFPQRAKVFMTG